MRISWIKLNLVQFSVEIIRTGRKEDIYDLSDLYKNGSAHVKFILFHDRNNLMSKSISC